MRAKQETYKIWLSSWSKEKNDMKIFSEITVDKPKTPVLDKVNLPEDIKNLTPVELKTLADDVRAHMLYSVGQSGGHLGGGFCGPELGRTFLA